MHVRIRGVQTPRWAGHHAMSSPVGRKRRLFGAFVGCSSVLAGQESAVVIVVAQSGRMLGMLIIRLLLHIL